MTDPLKQLTLIVRPGMSTVDTGRPLSIHGIIVALRRSDKVLEIRWNGRHVSLPHGSIFAEQGVGQLHAQSFLVILRFVL